ncbi:S-adenosyl-L-methionine-dependent methyltransferases superfamily protein [Citrus sinensis]|uniref:S-adenosyl-L-methionine-dependent methyltransferases superfamily protein n=1 Tax=Citrus sinensis TaxID=2711 RepID=A0ACB8K660_CITSI|nr:S-adenosyl-L-methionine-dependent methyltransferases superfamily protein [Citrus sinensis]
MLRQITSKPCLSHPQFIFTIKAKNSYSCIILPYIVQTQVSNLQAQVGQLLKQLHNERSEPKATTPAFSKQTMDRRGFFKCADCFNLSQRRWDIPTSESMSAEFTIDEVLRSKPGEIQIGLDFSPTTGTFAAMMRERNNLRPKGLLWVDRFFCTKDGTKLYLDEFPRLGYKKLIWRIVPKTDQRADELFFSAILEKPSRS